MSDGKSLKAAIYARSSLGIAGGQDPSLQVLELNQIAEQRGLKIFDTYIDVASGSLGRERRPALDQLLQDAEKGKFNILLLSALDRAFRSTKEMLQMVEDLDHWGVKIYSRREALDFTSPMGRMMLTVLTAVATLERDILRARVKTGMAMRKLAAENAGLPWRVGRPPISKEIIKQVIELRQDRGMSIRGIERALNRKVSRASISRILAERVPEVAKKGGQ